MRIVIETIPHADQRYPTLGDWQWIGDNELVIRVSEELGNSGFGFWYPFLVALHELVEVALCRNEFVTERDVDKFDQEHLDSEEPGLLSDAPYHKQHMRADVIERLMASYLGVEWNEYDAVCRAIASQPTAGEVPVQPAGNGPEPHHIFD